MPPRRSTRSTRPTAAALAARDPDKVYIPIGTELIAETGDVEAYTPMRLPSLSLKLRKRLLTRAEQNRRAAEPADVSAQGGPSSPAAAASGSGSRGGGASRRGGGGTAAQGQRAQDERVSPQHRQAEEEEEGGVRGDLQVAAEQLLQSKDRMKHLVEQKRLQDVARGVRDEVGDIYTDDIEEELSELIIEAQGTAPFDVGASLRISVRKTSMRANRVLESIPSGAFDLYFVSVAIDEELTKLKEKLGREVIVAQQTAFMRGGRITLRHDVEELDLDATEAIWRHIQSIHEEHPRARVELIIEIKADPAPMQVSRKRKASPLARHEDGGGDSPEMLSSPPLAPPRKVSKRTSYLQAQADVRLEKLQIAGDHDRQLVDRYHCHSKNCSNRGNFCYVPGGLTGPHYNITHVQMETWASAIGRADATISNPPASLMRYWMEEQGDVSHARPSKPSRPERVETSLEELHATLKEQRLRAEIAHEDERINQRRDAEDRRRDREEERQEEQAYRRRQRTLQMQQQDEQWRGLPGLNPYFPGQPAPSPYPPPAPPAPHSPHPPQGMLPQHAPLRFAPRIPVAHPATRSSSPVTRGMGAELALVGFFKWLRSRASSEARRLMLYNVERIVNAHAWELEDIKGMADDTSRIYARAVEAGIPDGIARRLHGDLHDFKIVWRDAHTKGQVAVFNQRLSGGSSGEDQEEEEEEEGEGGFEEENEFI